MAGKLNARAFDGQTLIMHRSFRSDVWDLWLNQVGLDLRRVSNVVEFDNMVAVTRAAERDGGIALVPRSSASPGSNVARWCTSRVRLQGDEAVLPRGPAR